MIESLVENLENRFRRLSRRHQIVFHSLCLDRYRSVSILDQVTYDHQWKNVVSLLSSGSPSEERLSLLAGLSNRDVYEQFVLGNLPSSDTDISQEAMNFEQFGIMMFDFAHLIFGGEASGASVSRSAFDLIAKHFSATKYGVIEDSDTIGSSEFYKDFYCSSMFQSEVSAQSHILCLSESGTDERLVYQLGAALFGQQDLYDFSSVVSNASRFA